jgi:hypothetical protein
MENGEEHAVRRAAILRLFNNVIIEQTPKLRVAPHSVLRSNDRTDAAERCERERPL